MTLPRVTVVVANFNYGRWIEGCLDSAAAQDYSGPLQVAVVDDGSTDDSVEIVFRNMRDTRHFDGPDGVRGVDGIWKESKVPILLVACAPAKGPSAARNVAIKCVADGADWFQILDADDELYPHKIRTLVEATQPDPENVGFVYGDYDNVDEADVAIRVFKEPFSRERLLHECVPHSGSLVSRKWLDVVGGFDEQLRCAEDFDLWLRLSERSEGRSVAESLTKVRVGSHNSTATVPSETWQRCWQRVAQKTRERGLGLLRCPN